MVRGDAYLCKEIAKARMTCFYKCKVKEKPLMVGDLVMKDESY